MAKKKENIKKEVSKEVEVLNPEDVIIANEKKEGKKRFFDEIKAFLILLVIFAVVIAGGWYWYSHVYKNTSEKEKPQVTDEMGYEYIHDETEDNNYFKILDNKYVVLSDDTSVLKIMDLDLNVIYENEVEYTGYYVANDGNLYFYNEDEENGSNVITLYRLEDKDLVEVKELAKDSTYFKPIYVKNNGEDRVIGYVGVYDGYNEDYEHVNNEYVYLLNGKEYELKNISLISDDATLAVTDPIYMNNDKYIIYMNENDKYGVYNILDNAVVIDATYDRLYSDYNRNNYIALKGDKVGIIDTKLRKVVDYNYDFIAANDGFYVVGKDNKLAIMDSNYKFVTDFVFDFQDVDNMGYLYHTCCGNFNTFEAYKVNDKYLLVTNINDDNFAIPYNKNEAYVIDSNGNYDVINENALYLDKDNNIIWTYDKTSKQYTFYNLDFKELYKLDFKDYDYDGNPSIDVAFNTIYTSFLGSKLYYDLNTGKNINNINDYEEKFLDEVIFKLNGKDKKVKVTLKDKELYSYDFDEESKNDLFVKVSDNQAIYWDEHHYFMIRKGD